MPGPRLSLQLACYCPLPAPTFTHCTSLLSFPKWSALCSRTAPLNRTSWEEGEDLCLLCSLAPCHVASGTEKLAFQFNLILMKGSAVATRGCWAVRLWSFCLCPSVSPGGLATHQPSANHCSPVGVRLNLASAGRPSLTHQSNPGDLVFFCFVAPVLFLCSPSRQFGRARFLVEGDLPADKRGSCLTCHHSVPGTS